MWTSACSRSQTPTVYSQLSKSTWSILRHFIFSAEGRASIGPFTVAQTSFQLRFNSGFQLSKLAVRTLKLLISHFSIMYSVVKCVIHPISRVVTICSCFSCLRCIVNESSDSELTRRLLQHWRRVDKDKSHVGDNNLVTVVCIAILNYSYPTVNAPLKSHNSSLTISPNSLLWTELKTQAEFEN
jgi:hypothetical protein